MDSREYDLEYFRNSSFSRRQCKSCRRSFWTVGQSEYCGEPPCVDYTFLGNSPMKKRLDVREMREEFLSFMSSRGHTRIGRYPVMARWRTDVFFVQASIYNFQPWVIGGTVEPPANPLTMSQPCLRFVDIDNVGKTGRHFTLFEMMTHTCFNTRGKQVYFKDRTVELCHEFLTSDLGIDPGLITYKEEEWAGGGNSGPCFEVMVEGSEVATLVFMMYRDGEGGRVPMDMTVVDTGYGLERLAWVSQGSPSAYEAVFGNLLGGMKDELGIQGDDRMLSEYSRVAGLMDAKTPGAIGETRKIVARNIGISQDDLLKNLLPLENMYVLLDHTRSLAVMLHDGVMPSNVKEGYFARLLIRRGLRALRALDGGMRLSDVVGRQLDYWSKDFPELKEEREDILKLVDVEQNKYEQTVSRGRALVTRMEASRKGSGLGMDQLAELYESQGLSPEQVAEFASGPVHVPDDFYAQIAARHSTAAGNAEERQGGPVLPGLPPTVRAYYESQYTLEFTARVLYCKEGAAVLDRTYFYPEGGGQDPDNGYIDGRRVTDVRLNGNVIVHYFEGRILEEGSEVRCAVDRERRMNLMRHHTATHVLIAGARKVLGNHVWQAGAHKQSNVSRLDITHFAQLSAKELDELEETVNRVVFENRKITVEVMNRIAAEGRYGFRLYQGGVVPGRDVRVVTIEGWDVEACAGTHCERTGEIGTVKILQTQRIQDGVVRIEFVAGLPALRVMQKRSVILETLRERLNSDEEHVIGAVDRLSSDLVRLEKSTKTRETASLEALSEQLLRDARMKEGTKIVFRSSADGPKMMQSLMQSLTSSGNVLAVLVAPSAKNMIMAGRGKGCRTDCSALLRKISAAFGGAGGGTPDFAQGMIRVLDEERLMELVQESV